MNAGVQLGAARRCSRSRLPLLGRQGTARDARAGTAIFERRARRSAESDTSGQAYFEGNKIDEIALFERLSTLVKEKSRVHLVLFADKETPHGSVVRIMDLSKRAGVNSIIIAAKWKTEFEF